MPVLAHEPTATHAAATLEQAESLSGEHNQTRASTDGRRNGDSPVYAASKRAFDVALSALAVAVAAPVMALIALAVRLESKGPVLFGHVRLGKDGRYFRCYKFRTMRADAQWDLHRNPVLKRIYEENDFKIPLDKDPRITRCGRFLRKSSLDELPQFFNVIGGSMSLVGPRPIVPDELRWYEGKEQEFLSVRPGITGAWQVMGRSRIGYPERTQIELEAIQNRSFWRDVKVLAASVPAVITSRGSL